MSCGTGWLIAVCVIVFGQVIVSCVGLIVAYFISRSDEKDSRDEHDARTN